MKGLNEVKGFSGMGANIKYGNNGESKPYCQIFPVHFVFNFFSKQNLIVALLMWYPELHVCLSCGQTLS